jgi:hypothetical protein
VPRGRLFAVDVLVCGTCGGTMRILAILPEGEASRTILEHLGLQGPTGMVVVDHIVTMRRPPDAAIA